MLVLIAAFMKSWSSNKQAVSESRFYWDVLIHSHRPPRDPRDANRGITNQREGYDESP